MNTPQAPGRRLVDLADTMIRECNVWIHVAETRADISPPLDPEGFRLAKARAEQIKAAIGRREPIPPNLLDSMLTAYEEGCKQR